MRNKIISSGCGKKRKGAECAKQNKEPMIILENAKKWAEEDEQHIYSTIREVEPTGGGIYLKNIAKSHLFSCVTTGGSRKIHKIFFNIKIYYYYFFTVNI